MMNTEEIKAIALEVAKEMYVGEAAVVERYSLVQFATRLIARLAGEAEPVGEVDGFGMTWWKKRPPQGTKLYAHPIPEPAPQERITRPAELPARETPVGAASLQEDVRAHSDERQALQRNVLALQQELAAMTKKLSECRNQYIGLEGMYWLLQQERDGLITDCVEKEASKNNMWFQLAASQAREARLREALYDASQIITFEGAMWYLLGLESRDDALAIPADTSALDARLAAQRGRCATYVRALEDNIIGDRLATAIRSLK